MTSIEPREWAQSIDRGEVTLDEITAAIGGGGLDLHLGLLAIERRLADAEDASTLRALAALLPRRIPADASASRRLAGLYERLWTWLEGPVLPDWRSWSGPLAARLAWIRAAALTDPAVIPSLVDAPSHRDSSDAPSRRDSSDAPSRGDSDESPSRGDSDDAPAAASAQEAPYEQRGSTLAAALDGLEVDAILYPAATLLALARAPSAELQAIAARLSASALERALVAPSDAHRIDAALARGVSPAQREAALLRLAQPWATASPLPAALVDDALAGVEPIAAAGLGCALSRGLAATVASVVADEEAPPRLRQAALRGLAELEGAEVSTLLAAALTDPVLFAGPALHALVALHRRGVFLREAELDDLLALYAADLRLSPTRAAKVAYISRRGLIARLQAGAPAELDLDRRVALLLEIDLAVAGEEDMSLVPWLLGQVHRVEDPRPILRALARHPRALDLDDEGHAAIEAAALGLVDACPTAALAALRAHGGAATRAMLRRRLGIEPRGPIDLALIADHEDALALLWHLDADDPDARAALLHALGDEPLPTAILDDLGPTTDADEVAALARRRARPHRDARRAHALVARIEGLAAADRAASIPAIERAIVELAGAIAAGDHLDPEAHGEAREQLPDAVLDAIRRLGERLARRRRIRPAILCAAAPDVRGAGRDLLAEILAHAVSHSDDDPRALAVLLRTLARAPHPRLRSVLLPLRRRRDPALRKLVIAALAGLGAEDLASDLRALVAADDLESARQAVIALGKIGALEHADTIASLLDHPNMNLKKAAAEALAHAGAPAAVGRLIFWLGHHDNPGFRVDLLAALDAILGPAATATILAALEREDAPRRRALLIAALDRRLEIPSIRRHAAVGATWAAELLAAIHDGVVHPSRGDAAALQAELERHGVASPRPAAPVEAIAPVILELVRHGVDDRRAAALLDHLVDAPLRPAERQRLRPHVRALLEWSSRAPSRAREAIALIAGIVAEAPPAAARPWARTVDVGGPDERARAKASPAGPLTADELGLFAHHHPALLDALAAAVAPARGPLLDLADALVPSLGPAQALLLGHVLRDLSPGPNSRGRSPLTALRRAGLVVERGDVARALADAAGTADPAALERAILGDAFLVAGGDPSHLPEGAAKRLDAALDARDPAVIDAALREHRGPIRATVQHLVDRFPGVDERCRPVVLDWLHRLQPLDTPAWDRPPEPLQAHRPRADERGQPPSAARLRVLFEHLESPLVDLRAEAVKEFAAWPTLAVRRIGRDAYLEGKADVAAIAPIFADLAPIEPSIVAGPLDADRARRLDRWLAYATIPDSLIPPLITRWLSAEDPEVEAALARIVGRLGNHRVYQVVAPALRRGQWGALSLLRGPLHPRALPDDLLAHPSAASIRGLAERLAALRHDPKDDDDRAPAIEAIDRPALFARLGDLEGRAPADSLVADLKRLAHAPDQEFIALCRALVGHNAPGLRLAALRMLRRHGSRDDVLAANRQLLGDPRPDVRRSAILSLAHAGDEASIPAILEFVSDAHNGVRRAVEGAIRLFGESARGPLVVAIRAARRDRRPPLQALLDGIDEDE